MKKKILVSFTGSMDLGGIERSLLGLLEALDFEKYDVDLFLYAHHGPLFSLIDNQVNILPEIKELAYLRESLKTKLLNGCYYSALLRIRDSLLSPIRTIDYDRTWDEVLNRFAKKNRTHYDIALGFYRSFEYISRYVDADIKIGWVHTDYTKAGGSIRSLINDFEKVDYIAAVSEDCADSFTKVFPQFSNRMMVIENVLSPTFIKREADRQDVSEEMPEDGSVKILSIGRFHEQKNFDEVPQILKLIRNAGVNAKWYLIGFGGEEDLIRERIKESGMDEYVIILGKKDNPYPYIKQCDIYAQPSRYEGKSVAVREAQILNKPVIITNYPTAKSQLHNGVDGAIVPMNTRECADAMVDIINNNTMLNRFVEGTKHMDYSNREETEKIYKLIRN